jgi:hypothetical protein
MNILEKIFKFLFPLLVAMVCAITISTKFAILRMEGAISQGESILFCFIIGFLFGIISFPISIIWSEGH